VFGVFTCAIRVLVRVSELERAYMSPGLIPGLEWLWARVQGRQRAVACRSRGADEEETAVGVDVAAL